MNGPLATDLDCGDENDSLTEEQLPPRLPTRRLEFDALAAQLVIRGLAERKQDEVVEVALSSGGLVTTRREAGMRPGTGTF